MKNRIFIENAKHAMSIKLDDGGEFRMGRLPDVVAGNWYVGVKCKSCAQLIAFGVAAGAIVKPFHGNGVFSIPCDKCPEDTNYGADEVFTFRAERSIKRNRPTRREPSQMPRQPIANKYPKVKATFGPGFLEDRPANAALVGRCIGLWSVFDLELARLLATLLKANTEAAVAVFLAIQNARVQGAVLVAAAETVLNEKDFDLFSALMVVVVSVEKERNALAHGIFGGSEHIKDGVAWINPSHLSRYQVQSKSKGVTKENQEWVNSKIFVYEPADLETIARDIESLQLSVSAFIGYVHAGLDEPPAPADWLAERYLKLCSEPRIRYALDQLLARKQPEEE